MFFKEFLKILSNRNSSFFFSEFQEYPTILMIDGETSEIINLEITQVVLWNARILSLEKNSTNFSLRQSNFYKINFTNQEIITLGGTNGIFFNVTFNDILSSEI